MRILPAVAIVAMLMSVGCVGCGGSDGPRRVAVTGTVTRDGAAVDVGSVAILPRDGHPGPAAVGAIDDGEFEFTASTGPTPGPHEVVIRSMLPKDELMRLQAAGEEPQMTWTFPVEIPDADAFHQEFVLKPDERADADDE